MERARRAAHRARRWLLDALGIAAAVAYSAPTFTYPFGIDTPIHWYIGRRLLEGEMPYASAVSTKPPAVFVVHAISQLLFGGGTWGIRIVDLAFVLLTGFFVATFRARRTDPVTGVVHGMPARLPGEIGAACLLVSGLYYTYFDFSDTAHPELWEGWFMLAAGWIVVRAPDGDVSLRRAAAAGVVACLAVTFKHVAATTGVFCGAAVVFMPLAKGQPLKALANGGVFTLAVALLLGLTILPFLLTGTFDAFWELMVDFIFGYWSEHPLPAPGVPRFLTHAYGLYAVVASIVALAMGLGAAAVGKNRRELWVGRWVVAMLIAGLASVAIQKRVFSLPGFSYHFIAAVPFFALALSWGLRVRFWNNGLAQLGTAFLLVMGAFYFEPSWHDHAEWSYRREWASFTDWARGRRSDAAYHEIHTNGPIEAHNRLVRVAAAINRHKRAGDTLCVDGFVSHLYQMTDLRCGSRFFVADGVGENPAWRAEYQHMLAHDPPTFFVTFGGHPRIGQLTRTGYAREDIVTPRVTYVIMIRGDVARARHIGSRPPER